MLVVAVVVLVLVAVALLVLLLTPYPEQASIDETFRKADGSALYNTCWVALTDATTANSCLHFIPSAADPGYSGAGDLLGEEQPDPLQRVFEARKEAYQQIRAAPIPAGTLRSLPLRVSS